MYIFKYTYTQKIYMSMALYRRALHPRKLVDDQSLAALTETETPRFGDGTETPIR